MAYKRLEQSGDPPSSHQAEAHAREAMRAFHQKSRATSSSLKSQVIGFRSIRYCPLRSQLATTSLATSWRLTAESWLASGTVESIRIAHNTFHGLHDACVYAATGNVFVEANEMVQCADLGASAPLGGALIRIGQGRARIQGNWGYRPSGAPGSAYRYGIQWDGATYSQRSAANNVWYNFGAAAETGTM